MNKINELKPGDESIIIEALINRVVTGKTNVCGATSPAEGQDL